MNAGAHDVERQMEAVRTDGFVVVRGMVGPDEAALMRERLQRAVDEDLVRWSGNPHYRDHWMVHNLLLRDPVFLRFLENPVLHQCLSALLSPWCILYAYTSSSLPPRGSNYSRRIHTDAQAACQPYVSNVGVLLALDDFTEENGATAFLPGSHRRLQPPTEAEFVAGCKQVFPRAGDAVVFNAHTYHMGGQNHTERARHAISMNACRHWMKQRFDYPRMISREQVEMLSDLGRRFVGMFSRPPESLEEYYVEASERSYWPGQT